MRRLILVFSLFVFAALLIGCAAPANELLPSDHVEGGNIGIASEVQQVPVVQGDDRFIAETVADGSVALSWLPIEGAEKYLLELQMDDGNHLTIALLNGDVLSYVDENLPPETQFTYQLTAVSGSERKQTRQVSVTTAAIPTDPITVTLEFDQSQPIMDFSTIDPDNLDPEALADLFSSAFDGGDASSFDMSSFVPTPITSTALIGPEGGEVSVTGSTGFVYTLDIPEGALPVEIPVTLKPIANIPDLPLSGGLDGAVLIEPAGITLEVPATLTISAPEGYAASAGEYQVGFAFDAGGSEFHLYPLLEGADQASTGFHLAKVNGKTRQAGPLAEIARQQLDQFAGYGKGSGTKADIKKVNNRASTQTRNRAAAQAAFAQQSGKFVRPVEEAFDEELAPLVPPQALRLAQYGQAILQKASGVSDWNTLMNVLDDFNVYYQNDGDKYNQALNNRILDALVKHSYELLQKNKGQCLVADDIAAQTLVERLVKAQNKTYKALGARFKEQYGEKLINDLYNGVKACSFKLDVNSSISYESDGSVWFTTTKVNQMPLYPVFANGSLFLWGSGLMQQAQSISGACYTPVSQYSDLYFLVQKMEPLYKGKELVDFELSNYSVQGMESLGRITTTGETCLTSLTFQGGGDFWTAFFTIARATSGVFSLNNWQISGDRTGGGSLTALWSAVRPEFSPMNQGGKMSEDSKFTLTVTSDSRK